MAISVYYRQFTGIEVVAASSQRMIGGGSLTKKESRVAQTTPTKTMFENVAKKVREYRWFPAIRQGLTNC